MAFARYDMGTCVIAGELYVTGGIDADGGLLSSVEKYSPSSDTWSTATPLPEARSRHAAVAVGSVMYVLGGIDRAVTASVLKFDSTQGTWSQLAPMPEARYAHAACAIGSDIFVFGGRDLGGDQASVFKYDTVANEWSTLAPMPYACSEHTASALDGLIYIVGVGNGRCEVLRFDPVSSAWSTLAPTASSRDDGSSFVLGGCLYAVGGGMNDQTSVERYDVASNTWTAVANMLLGRNACVTVSIGSVGPAEEQDLFDLLIAKALSGRS
jgi:hypothetical protein